MSGTKVDVTPTGDMAPDPTGFRYNSYATKKTLAKGLLDISLLMANASQLKSLISLGPGTDYYYANMVMISLSIVLQIITGILLLVLGSMEGKDLEGKKAADKLNNVTVGFVFAITVINLFVAAFGIKLSER
ncbi:ninjurin-1-like [Dreissena polymorpha]|uniref:Ninjurin-2 n=1 Tax=Dreissena polymorpha TaxID=45954 RepID=A0A9D4MUF3_DREPO|nr:ninjurin-1-like [Dreissena polymorpha]KAH3881427.1 hypothetical protein DPMN_005353 [Dreissena polymorpha]